MPAETTNRQPPTIVLAVAWAVLLAVSLAPTVIAQEVFHAAVSPDLRAEAAVIALAAGFGLTLVWSPARSLRPLLVLFLVLVGAQWLVYTRLDRLAPIASWVDSPSFNIYMLAEQGLNLVVTLAMIAALFAIHRNRSAFYLARGDIAAPATQVSWLAIKRGDRWSTVGRNLAVFISLGTLAFLVLSGRPSVDMLAAIVPFVPVILLAAALNAFNEEVTYKASFLSVLVGPFGEKQTLRMVAAYFGIAHFYGVPYGLIGVALAWFLGWVLARSMLETRGLFWAWCIHFVQDVLIFGFLAAGSITPGG